MNLSLFDFTDDHQADAPGVGGALPAAVLAPPRGATVPLPLPLPVCGPVPGLCGVVCDAFSDSPEESTSDEARGTTDPAAHQPPGLDLALHPAVWRASQIGGGTQATSPSGFAALDAELPGGGWPHGVLTELLLPQPGIGELRLLAPVLAAVSATRSATGLATAPPDTGRCVMLFDPPASLSAWALLQCGLDSRHWLVVRSRPAGQGRHGAAAAPAAPAWQPDTAPGVPRGASRLAPLLPGADLLWALEQALKSGQVGAVLAWLPLNLRADALRRLQLAAQAQAGPVFLFRDALARSRPSPAPLRVLLQPAGRDALGLRLLKRRGPLLAQPLRLQLPPVLPDLPDMPDPLNLPATLQAQARAQAEKRQRQQGQGQR